MIDRNRPSIDQDRNTSTATDYRLETVLNQLLEDYRLYNKAVGSYNTHLDNHRDRRDLHDISYRRPISAHDAHKDALGGDRAAIESLLMYLLDQAKLDSQLRRHPGAYPIHIEAVEHLEIAREHLITTLEEALRYMNAEEHP